MKNNKAQISEEKNLSALQLEIVEKLAYFAVFKYPTTAAELQNLTRNYYALSRIYDALKKLCVQNLCYQYGDYFSGLNSVEADVLHRKQGEENATALYKKLPFYTRIISHFPYVRGVAVSGSLSKGVIHKNGDIDYFIITSNNRLWLARVLLVAFKKIFLFNSHRYFCVNYFISEKHLEIPDKNIFTATEISTLLPVYGVKTMAAFKAKNKWVNQFYGHFEHPQNMQDFSPGMKPVKRFLEILLNNPLGNLLDILCMHITVRRWDVKFKHFSRAKFQLTLRSTRNASKHHPRDFQTLVLEKYKQQKAIMLTTNISEDEGFNYT